MTAVLTGEFGENKHDTIIPVPAPVKKSTTDFLMLYHKNDYDATWKR